MSDLRTRPDRQYFVFAHDQEFFAVNLDFASGILPEEDAIAFFDRHFKLICSVFQDLAIADSDHESFLRLLFGGVGNNDSALGLLSSIDPFEQNAIMQRSEAHTHSPRFGKDR